MTLVILPVLSLIKAAIYTPVISLMTAVSVIATTLLLLPYHIFKACRFLVLGKSVDVNIKILLSLALLLAIPLWPLLVIIACCLLPLIVFVVCVCDTFIYYLDSDNGFSILAVFNSYAAKQCHSLVVDFWHYSSSKLPAVIDEMCSTYYDGIQYKLKLTQLLIDIPVVLLSLLIDVMPVLVICLLRYLPFNLYLLYALWINAMGSWVAVLPFIPCLVITAALPLLSLVAIPLIVLASSFYNLKAVIIMYQTASVREGLQTCFKLYANTLYYIDSTIGEWSCIKSCLTHFDYRQQLVQHETVIEQSLTAAIPIMRIWDSFFTMLESTMLEVMHSRLCSREDVESIEPYLVLGLPSLVFCRTLQRSADCVGIKLANGEVIDANTAPNSYLTELLLPKFMSVKAKFDTLQLSEVEYTAVENWLLLGGKEEDSNVTGSAGSAGSGGTNGSDRANYGSTAAVSGKAVNLTNIFVVDSRHKAVMSVMADIQSFATHVSRIPIFQSRFGETCKLVLAKTSV